MAYDNIITRSGAEALIPEQVSREIIQHVPQQSTFLRLANQMPNMTSKQTKIPVMTGNVDAYFVTGDTGLKNTSMMSWNDVYITAEELAVIVPIPEAVLDDASYDIWGQVQPRIEEAFGKAIDAAAFFGTNKPSSWPTGIVPGAVAASQAKQIGSDLYQDINGVGGVVAMVEDKGLPVTSYIGAVQLRSMLRGAADDNGQPIFRQAYSNGAAGGMTYDLNGVPVEFPVNGSWDATQALLLAGDFSLARYAIRQDITYKLLTEAPITDATGKVILNLAQQDCVALRAVMRLGWALPNPIHRVGGTTYYPFAVLTPASGNGDTDHENP